MIIPIALAKDGFIDINQIGFATPQTYDFEETLKLIFNFENKDLQFFDGNTCQIINSYDPTNSIFIFENQQGKFLYKITSANAVVHKNNMIWLCNCYKMEDFANINNILNQEQSNGERFGVVANIQKNIAHSKINLSYTPNVIDKYLYKVEIKNNFETFSIDKFFIGTDWNDNQNFTLKIKCLVNPTTENLISTSADGSFNFLFPIKASGNYSIGNLPTLTSKITNGTITISIADIVSKYSENIKSIELLPFSCENILFGTSMFEIQENENILTISTLTETTKFTDCGIFIEQGFTNFFNLINITKKDYPLQLVAGGGMQGFVQTPIGNINIDFSSIFYNEFDNIVCAIKEDGFKIDGFGKAEIPPMYLNFYTDNAGQVFIQNLTTNAQELRQLERETIAKQEEQQQQYVLDQFKNVSNFDILNPSSWLSSGINALLTTTQNEFEKEKINREYRRSLIDYKDKLKTQSLLASFTGKQISGNYSIIDFLIALNSHPFLIVFEKNFYRQQRILKNTSISETAVYVIQQNYDYSTSVVEQNLKFNNSNITQPLLIIDNEDFTQNYPHCWSDIARFIANIFSGNPTENGVLFCPVYYDEIGTNFTIQFKLSNFINSNSFTFDDLKKQKETLVLNFQVRTHKKR